MPVPIFQAIDSFAIFGILLLIERHFRDRPVGFIVAATMALWGLARFLEENVWLRQNDHNGSILVQGAGLALFVAGIVVMVLLRRNQLRRPPVGDDGTEPPGEGSGEPEDDAVDGRDVPADRSAAP